MHTNLTVNPS